MTRIPIVDDDDVVRQGLKSLLDRPGWEIVGEAAGGIAAAEAAERTKPDIVVLGTRCRTKTARMSRVASGKSCRRLKR